MSSMYMWINEKNFHVKLFVKSEVKFYGLSVIELEKIPRLNRLAQDI